MCGRFYTDVDDEEYRRVLALLNARGMGDAPPTMGEIAPTNVTPVLAENGLTWMRWGFAYGKSPLIINARSETLTERPAFANTARCLVPANAYFEWEKRGAERIKYRLRPERSGLFCFAGLYRADKNGGIPLFVLLTKPAAPEIAFIHDRMPIMLDDGMCESWLRREQDAAKALCGSIARVAYEPCG